MGANATDLQQLVRGYQTRLPPHLRPPLNGSQRPREAAERATVTDTGTDLARLEINARLPWGTALEILWMLKDKTPIEG